MSPTADNAFWADRRGSRFPTDHPLLRLMRDYAAHIAATVRAQSAAEEDRIHMAYCASLRNTYLTNTAVDTSILDTIFRTPPSIGRNYLPFQALTWWEGRGVLPTCIGWEPGALTDKVATVAFIAPEQHFAYDGGPIVVRDSWHGPDATGLRFDARRAAFGDETLR